MSPRMGRPIAGSEPKNRQIALRATETTVKKFQKCTEVVEKGIDLVYKKLPKQK